MANRNSRTICYTILVVILLLGIYSYSRPVLIRKDSSADIHKNKPRDYEVTETRSKGALRGYVIGWDFHEGQTSASRNLLSLVHWAGDMNMAVVEPCVYNSFFNLANCVNIMGQSSNSMPLLFRDYFDIDHWNHQTSLHKIGKPLLAWKEFIKNMPSEAIIVYTWPAHGKKSAVFVDDGIRKDAMECYGHENKAITPQFSKETFSKLGIKIAREVCFRFNRLVPIDLQWFNRQILGGHKKSNILILFTSWIGTFKGRMYLNKKEYRYLEAFDYLKPSPRVVEHSKKYAEQFLGGKGYVAVQLRTMKMVLVLRHSQHMSQEDIVHFFNENCSQQVLTVLKKLEGKRLLAVDLGRFGDQSFEMSLQLTNNSKDQIVPKLLSSVYDDVWNQAQWEDSFVQVTGGITDSGYIAMMQKILVSNAACIVIGGGGQFHNSLMMEYKKTKGDPCVYEVCTV